jgi:hypothetical protein
MVVWVERQRHFFPNWEVEKIVRIPLRNLLESSAYACYRISFEYREKDVLVQDFPCFLHQAERESEILWGVTYRIVTAFLEYVFGFNPPPLKDLPVIEGRVGEKYLRGAAEQGKGGGEDGGSFDGLTTR